MKIKLAQLSRERLSKFEVKTYYKKINMTKSIFKNMGTLACTSTKAKFFIKLL